MATPQSPDAPTAADAEVQKGGAYEVLRARLAEQCAALRSRVEALNAKRKDVFGGMETTLAASTRIPTEHSCIPRDIIHVGQKLVMGFEVFLGLKKETAVSDVFAVYDFDGAEFKSLGLDFLNDEKFTRDFKEIFQYYKSAKLAQLHNTGTQLLFVFQIGAGASDVKVLRWAIQRDGSVAYVDNRGERDYVFPKQHDFEWTRTQREDHIAGKHPHVSIEEQIFVECTGGDLTIKIENNTESGQGIYSEPVNDPDQSLDDAEIFFAALENLILLKVRPYGEEAYRYIVYSRLTQRAKRIDAIGAACVQLPEGHGIIFPGGYVLQTGESKEFDGDASQMEFFKVVKAGNGEDVLYLFYHRVDGRYVLLPYNLVRKEVATPIICHGYSLYDDGKLAVFRNATNEASRSHAVQIWQTPFIADDRAPNLKSDSYLGKIGNKDLVNGISDSLTLAKLAMDSTPTAAAYQDLNRQADAILDRYHWLDHAECQLGDIVRKIREAGNTILEEFEKVLRIQQTTAERISAFAVEFEETAKKQRPETLRSLEEHVQALGKLRTQRGQLVTLRDLRYADLPRLQAMDEQIVARNEEVSKRTVRTLLAGDAMTPFAQKLDGLLQRIEKVEKATETDPIQKELNSVGGDLDLLTDVINALKIDDSTARTAILETLSSIYGHLNRAKASLAGRRKDLLSHELTAEFGAQFKLIGQSLANFIGLCDTPEKCDDLLGKMLVQIEELEGRFSDFPEFIEKIGEKREEIHSAFSARKQTLLDERQRKASALFSSADRILKNVARRAQSFTDADALNAYFAADPMVQKAAETVKALRQLGDSVKADDLASRLKSGKEEALRVLRDKQDIFEDGANIIKLGTRRFSVNAEPLDVTLILHDGAMHFHVSGTDYHERVTDEKFLATERFWSQTLPSENADVYRCEFLAFSMLTDAERGAKGLALDALNAAAMDGTLAEIVRKYASELYEEGYERGIHDTDAAKILSSLLKLRAECGLLRFDPASRFHAALFWSRAGDRTSRELLRRKAQSLGRMQKTFGAAGGVDAFIAELAGALSRFATDAGLTVNVEIAANYLFHEISQEESAGFVVSRQASDVHDAFLNYLDGKDLKDAFLKDLNALDEQLTVALDLARAWTTNYFAARVEPERAYLLDDVVSLLMTLGKIERATITAEASVRVEGLMGQHRRIEKGALSIRLDEFLSRVARFAAEDVPGYRAYHAMRKDLVEREKERLRLDSFKAKAMSTFVRNKLISDVYLPMVGENFSKQLGEAGPNQRTDRQGLLLLISPPGYGKTTLMEYVAARLGLVFMKINGPALGAHVLSLDPAEAPNATAREEVEKLNLSFEMGNNVMIYLDDIQHTNPEFLQKFISLCDAQRKIEGVYKGRTRTYDFRGKKVAVVMAGNPYTETGARFQIPDMLANRADVYNLGDVIGGRIDHFELSYLENAITSNATLSPLAMRDPKDFYKLVAMADGEQVAETDLGHDYSALELKDMLAVIRKLRVVQKVALKVNQGYIQSAAQQEEYRTEPTFKLQGSYRNMNKMTAKVVPVLSDTELEGIIADHYAGESQALASAAEHNLLKLAEIRGTLAGEKLSRWEEIKRAYKRNQLMHGADGGDKAAQVVAQLSGFNEQLDGIRQALAVAASRPTEKNDAPLIAIAEALEKIGAREPAAPATYEPKVEVINTLPAYYTNLYKHHLDIVETILVPILKGVSEQLRGTEEAQNRLADVSARLKAVITELSAQKRREGKPAREDGSVLQGESNAEGR